MHVSHLFFGYLSPPNADTRRVPTQPTTREPVSNQGSPLEDWVKTGNVRSHLLRPMTHCRNWPTIHKSSTTAPWDARANLLALPNLTTSCILTAASTAKLTEFLATNQPTLTQDEPLSSACEAAILTSLRQNEQNSRLLCTDGVCEALQDL